MGARTTGGETVRRPIFSCVGSESTPVVPGACSVSVMVDLVVGECCEPNRGHFDVADRDTVDGHGDTGHDLMGRVRQLAEVAGGVRSIGGLSQNLPIDADDRVRSNDDDRVGGVG